MESHGDSQRNTEETLEVKRLALLAGRSHLCWSSSFSVRFTMFRTRCTSETAGPWRLRGKKSPGRSEAGGKRARTLRDEEVEGHLVVTAWRIQSPRLHNYNQVRWWIALCMGVRERERPCLHKYIPTKKSRERPNTWKEKGKKKGRKKGQIGRWTDRRMDRWPQGPFLYE